MAKLDELRRQYHAEICASAMFLKRESVPNMADIANSLSRRISGLLVHQLPYPIGQVEIDGQTAGKQFEEATKSFLERSFSYLSHIRPGNWQFSMHNNIADFDQYQHISALATIIRNNREVKAALGDYLITPDIVVGRYPVSDAELNLSEQLVESDGPPVYSPLRANNSERPTLHASISCKWTIRSDRSQNARTEGLNLIRNRKGGTPHIVVVTAEPLPSRISSLALGTGDIDCIYHFALPELINAIKETHDNTSLDVLEMMTVGRRLRDIADLPFDLAI